MHIKAKVDITGTNILKVICLLTKTLQETFNEL